MYPKSYPLYADTCRIPTPLIAQILEEEQPLQCEIAALYVSTSEWIVLGKVQVIWEDRSGFSVAANCLLVVSDG